MNERPQKPYKVVFMGSPDFSVPCLKALYESPDFEVKAVYSMPDKPKGRGKQLSPTPVKAFAIEHNITVRTPASFKKEPEEIEVLRSFEPDYLVVVAYGLILSQKVLDIPRIAAVNLHASLLPSFRGSSPMQYAILNGLKETGNTVMLMSKGMDEGDMLATNKISIEENDDLEAVHDKLSATGAPLLTKTLVDYAEGKITPVPQDHNKATYTAKITTETAKIDWNKPAQEIRNLIYAMSPFPGAWFECEKDSRIKVFRAKVVENETNAKPGELISCCSQKGLIIGCGNSTAIELLELQKPGKNRMNEQCFLCGCSSLKLKD
ncbi:MAG: methionyl-tRNA formyltransferase [Candidatus Riflebacteria bacterium]|nr:methionyl-tRNA formyltransferase [Candidatus Riflebacteria bacterium]